MRSSVLRTVLRSDVLRPGGRVCTPASYVCIGVCMCAPYVKCCVGSVTARAGHEPYLPYLPRISKYSYITLAHEERSRTYPYVRLQHALVSDLTLVSVDRRMNVVGHGEERASDTRGACGSAGRRGTTSSGKTGARSALMRHSSPERD